MRTWVGLVGVFASAVTLHAVSGCGSSSNNGGGGGDGGGGGGTSGNSLSGAFAFTPGFAENDAKFDQAGSSQPTEIDVKLYSVGFTCVTEQDPNRGATKVVKVDVSPTSGVIAAGTYPFTAGSATATVTYKVEDATGNALTDVAASSGSITLTSVNGGSVTGTFTATFGDDDADVNGPLSGSFTASVCPTSTTDGG